MAGYIVKRLGQAVVVIFGVAAAVFALERLLPGSAARAIIGPRATPGQIDLFNRDNGLNSPTWYQFYTFIKHLAHGNLGYSYKSFRPVTTIIRQEIPRDILLVGSATVLAVLIAIPVGVMQAVRRNTMTDTAGTLISFLLYSMPPYVPALLLIATFSQHWHLFPPQAPQEPTMSGIVSHPSGLVLPILSLTLITYALFSRYMRSSAIETLAEDYIRTARAKGVPERLVLWRHLLRNSLIPIVTLLGLTLPQIMTAGLITEQLFNFPGVGLQYFTAATQDDYPVMLGITVFVGIAVVVGNLLADVAYAALDPRVRYH